MATTDKMQEMVSFFELDEWLPEGLATQLSEDKCKSLSNGIQQKLRLALGLGNCEQSLIIIDEPFNGAEQENAHKHTFLTAIRAHSPSCSKTECIELHLTECSVFGH